MKTCLRILNIFIIFALVASPMFEHLYASIHQDCSCCNNKCQGAKKCHETAKVCLCSYSAPLQVYLLKSDFLPKFVFSGFFAQRLFFSYAYFFKEDIFHPPKA
jgi:hypothetical protein